MKLVNHDDCTEALKQMAANVMNRGSNIGYGNSKYLAVGPRLRIPAGIYHVKDTILIPGYCEVDADVGTVIIGDSPEMDDKPIFQCGGIDNVIRGINFVGGKYQILIHGTWFDPSNGLVGLWGNPEAGGRFHVEKCGFYDCLHSAITIGGLNVQNRTTSTAQVILSGCEAQCKRLWTGSADFLTIEKGRFCFDRRKHSGDFKDLGFINSGTPINIVDSVFGLRGDYNSPESEAALVRTNWGVHFSRCGQGDGKSVVVRLTNPIDEEDFTLVDNNAYPFIILDGCGFNGVADIYWLHLHSREPRKICIVSSVPFGNRPGDCLSWTKGIRYHENVVLSTGQYFPLSVSNWTSDNPDALRTSVAS